MASATVIGETVAIDEADNVSATIVAAAMASPSSGRMLTPIQIAVHIVTVATMYASRSWTAIRIPRYVISSADSANSGIAQRAYEDSRCGGNSEPAGGSRTGSTAGT